MKALIIDDDPTSSVILGAKLRQHEMESLAAPSIEKGLEILSVFTPDVIFLDLVIGTEDGLEFLKNRHKTPAIADIPVIIVSAKREFEAISNCLHAGAIFYLIKPIQPDLLISALIKLSLLKKLTDTKGTH